jgi:hypothetical protein
MDTITSKYFETNARSKRGRSEISPAAKEVWPSATTTPSPDILTKIPPTQQRVGKMKPQESTSPPIKFVPRCGRNSPENGHRNSNDVQVATKHHNTKNQSSSAHLESKSTGSGDGRAKPRLPSESLTTLSRSGFSYFVDEQSASGGKEESKAAAAKKTSRTKKDDEVSS